MGSLGKTLFCSYYILLGTFTMIYGILICLDKLRMESELYIRIIYATSSVMYGMAMGLEQAIEKGEYIFLCAAIGIVVFFIVLGNRLYKRCYAVFNLEEKEFFSCVKKVLDNMSLDYKVYDEKIKINNLCSMKIAKEYPYVTLRSKAIKDENLFKSVIYKIRNEVCNYELPKKNFHEGGYSYIGIGLSMAVGFSFMLFIVL